MTTDQPVVPVSSSLSVAEVLDRLRVHPRVREARLVGSAANGHRSGSDLDLLIVVEGPAPRLWITTTYVDGTPTDVVVVTGSTLTAFRERPSDVPGPVRLWLASLLAEGTAREPELWRWHALNVDAITVRRLAGSPQSVHLDELTAYLPALLESVWVTYFALRGLGGSRKDQLRHVQAHDPEWWQRFVTGLRAEPQEAAVSWLALAEGAAAPAGGLWPEGTVVEPNGDIESLDREPPSLSSLL